MHPMLEKLSKILDLEAEQGFEDTAVIGGLEIFIERWQPSAAKAVGSVPIRAISDLVSGYSDLDTDARADRLAGLRQRVEKAAISAKESAETKPKERRGRRAKRKRPSNSQVAALDLRPDDAPELSRPVSELKGIGEKSASSLKRLGIITLRDLLFHAPSRYKDFSRLDPIKQLRIGDETTVVATVWSVKGRRTRAGKPLTDIVLSDTTGYLTCTFFNQAYLAKEIAVGDQIAVSGKIESYAGRICMRAPEWENVDQSNIHTARLVPIYPLTEGIKQRWLRRQVKQAVDRWAEAIGEPLSASLRGEHALMALPDAIRNLHFPVDRNSLDRARLRLAFDELLMLQLWTRMRRRAAKMRPGIDLSAGLGARATFQKALPFVLTAAQRRCVEEIHGDLASDAPMSRLLQGDVGSGKTAVAGAAIAVCIEADHQAVLMAPTEILADQHFQGLSELFGKMGYQSFDPKSGSDKASKGSGGTGGQKIMARLVGSMSGSDKQTVAEALADGRIDLVVGTHAVIQDQIRFERLGLVIVDEQHRFGVLQRHELRVKGAESGMVQDATEDARTESKPDQRSAMSHDEANSTGDAGPSSVPHVLVMTATPIPRTLAQVINADLDQSIIDKLPPGGKRSKRAGYSPNSASKPTSSLPIELA